MWSGTGPWGSGIGHTHCGAAYCFRSNAVHTSSVLRVLLGTFEEAKNFVGSPDQTLHGGAPSRGASMNEAPPGL